ncbi:TOBE domain-containing protein [Natronoflexus pectinivorans]|uniref:Molybdate transport system regulatory protein n=1 Tax=Natronoflexus pectinivorans TaxID=682526 RepID=A0A4R2GFX6_9BACT|nr:TOBE domain-containing protein [Natronoflexus pectinivorans]TCO07143.1 molybdate transport system regulatory protein [Natronoflexus pectinivorans]
MNKIPAIIKNITASGGVVLVDLESDSCPLSTLLVDEDKLPEWLTIGASVSAAFKESELSLAVDLSGKISLRNKLPCTVKTINYGELLSIIQLTFGRHTIYSAITTRSVKALELKTGTKVTALIKANEISLMKSENGNR